MGLLRSLQENPYTERIASSPLLSVLSSIVAICVINRLVTGLQGTIAQNNRDAEKKVPSRIAYWFPWVGSAKVFVKNLENMISQDR